MNVAIIALFTLIATYVSTRRGPGAAFAYVFLPVLLLLGIVKPVAIEPLPDLNSQSAVVVGAILGMLISGRFPTLRVHWIDFLVVALAVSLAVTAWATGVFWTVVANGSAEVLRYTLPYFMARLAFQDPTLRRHMAFIVSFVAMAIAAMALIEFRLYPNFFARVLANVGLSVSFSQGVLGRMGLFRAMATTDHPIDLGNIGSLLSGLVLIFAITGGVAISNWRILGGIAAGGVCVLASLSFSSFAGCAAAGAIYLVLRYIRGSEYVLVPAVVAAIIGGFLFTQHLLELDYQELRRASLARRTSSENQSDLGDSFTVRVLIVQNAWNRAGVNAGYFGLGDGVVARTELGLESVDNSYMLFLLRRGWVHLLLRLSLGVAIAWIGMEMLRGARGGAARTPPATIVAILLGTMVAMYTVWFGFIYSVLWTATLGMAVTMRQVVGQRRAAARLTAFTPASSVPTFGPAVPMPR